MLNAQTKEKNKGWENVVAGGIAGLVSRFTIAPMDVLKIRLQLQISLPSHSKSPTNSTEYRNIRQTLRHILKQEGITALWKGNISAEILYMSYGGVQFLTYGKLVNLLRDKNKKLAPYLAGASAGTVATLVTYPLDVIRTRFAASGHTKVYDSILSSIRIIVSEEKWRGLYRGANTALIQIFPYMGLFFGTYENLVSTMTNAGCSKRTSEVTSAIVAGGFSKSIVYPLDTIRKRLQVQGYTRTMYAHKNIPIYAGAFDCLKRILCDEGVRGMYRGLSVSILKAAPASAVTMWTFEESMRLLKW